MDYTPEWQRFEIKLEISNIDNEITECAKHIRELQARRKELCDELIDVTTDIIMHRRNNSCSTSTQ